MRHRLSRSAADFFAADLDDDRRLVEQVDVLVAAGLLAITETDERMQPLALPFFRRDQPIPPAFELASSAEDGRSVRRQLAFPDAELRGSVDPPAVEKTRACRRPSPHWHRPF